MSCIEGCRDRANGGTLGVLFVPMHHHAARYRSNRHGKSLVIHRNMQPPNRHGMPGWATTLIDVGLTQPEKRVTSTSPIGVEVGADIAGAVAGAGVYLAHGSCRENVRKGLLVPNHAGVAS